MLGIAHRSVDTAAIRAAIKQPLLGVASAMVPSGIGASVGHGGDNRPMDVAVVRARLGLAGYPVGLASDSLWRTIARYQAERLGVASITGRIDPGDATERALATDAPAAAVVG